MKWWRRKDRRVVVDLLQGREAAKAMHEAEDRWPEVQRLSDELSRQSRANNFRRRFQAEFERARTEGS